MSISNCLRRPRESFCTTRLVVTGLMQVCRNAVLGRADFTMEKLCHGLQSQVAVPWMAIPNTGTSEWAKYV